MQDVLNWFYTAFLKIINMMSNMWIIDNTINILDISIFILLTGILSRNIFPVIRKAHK